MINILNNILFSVAVILITGLLFAQIVKKVKLPSVTGYLIGGLLIGPYMLNIIPHDAIDNLKIFSTIALGFIAFSIGSEFKLEYFKKVGLTPIIIAFAEAFSAVILVTISMLLLGNELNFSLMIGAIASATAPAATIMVIRQYQAKGPVTETLLSVVAIDDAAALIAFGFALAITNSLNSNANLNLLMFIEPFKEILISLIIGTILGILLSYFIRYFKDAGNRLSLMIAAVLFALVLSQTFKGSDLLVCMIFGAIYCNLSQTSDSLLKIVDNFTPPLFMLFFVLSGAELNIAIIPSIGIIGITYVIVRVVGKMLGAYLGAKISHADNSIAKYLGPCLIPQAGVAIGLSLIAQNSVPGHGDTIRAIILCATLIYELIGPFITKITLVKAKEIIE